MTDWAIDLAGTANRAIDPLHSAVYFTPDADAQYAAIGLRPGRMPYFASRSAPMGAVGVGVTTATFYNFNPELVAHFIPRAWTLASPEVILQARLRVADSTLRRLLGADILGSPELAEAAELSRTATAGLSASGRPLYAGHADLAWPPEPHLALWHGATLLREYRGDGHIAALLAADLDGIEAIVTHTASGRGFTIESAQRLRGWSAQQWSGAIARLAERGYLTAQGELTERGTALRATLEARTDELAAAAWRRLGEAGTRRFIELAKRFRGVLLAAGAFPPGVFATASQR